MKVSGFCDLAKWGTGWRERPIWQILIFVLSWFDTARQDVQRARKWQKAQASLEKAYETAQHSCTEGSAYVGRRG